MSVDDEPELRAIRRRWYAADTILRGWAAIPSARRERVLAELEEIARATQEREAEFASDVTAALDALDLAAEVGSMDFVDRAAQDIRVVLRALDETSRKR
jgi:hypothetical protein